MGADVGERGAEQAQVEGGGAVPVLDPGAGGEGGEGDSGGVRRWWLCWVRIAGGSTDHQGGRSHLRG